MELDDARSFDSGKDLTPDELVARTRALVSDWHYDAVSIGYPGRVGPDGPSAEPGNLADGWVGFDYPAAFQHPVRIVNDAAMQALGSYDGGRMLFLGLGTGDVVFKPAIAGAEPFLIENVWRSNEQQRRIERLLTQSGGSGAA